MNNIKPFYISFLLFLSIGILSSCHKKGKTLSTKQEIDTIPLLIMRIQQCSRLYTAEYHIHKIITHDDQKKISGNFMNKKFDIALPFGKRKIAIPIDAVVKAYIDFSSFSERNIKKKGKKITVILPDAKIILASTKINHKEIKQFVSFARSNFNDEELSLYEQKGRQSIINSIPKLGIIDLARENAARILIPMLSQLGYKESDIEIVIRKDFSLKNTSILLDNSTVENVNHK